MARKPSTRKRREPAPAASTRAEPAASTRPTTKPGAACLERVLTRDARFNLVAQLVDWCGRGAAGRAARRRGRAPRRPGRREIGAHDGDGGSAQRLW